MTLHPAPPIHRHDPANLASCCLPSAPLRGGSRVARAMPSMGSTGDAYDHAMAESFFATLEREVLNRRRFQSQAEARLAIFQWLEAGTIRIVATPLSATCHPSTTSGDSFSRPLETQVRTRPRNRGKPRPVSPIYILIAREEMSR